ncbi:MAG TPA: FMN-binding negative transcriptional regulator [Flavobacterium lutivivi]|nr:FMN-binding negative transcriptional regulator [Flavobacterium lutivivi]
MYIPNLYKNENQDEINQFLKENGFAILVNQTNGKLWATHIPLYFEPENNLLHGHFSIENPQATAFKNNDEVLAIFQGSHAYISSSWYDHENVPTWNYIAVHIYGKIKVLSLDETVLHLKKLVDKYEANQKNPLKVENLSRKTMMQSRGVIGIEIEITSIEAKKKLSQNRDDKNYNAIISKLDNSTDFQAKAIAEQMRKNRS